MCNDVVTMAMESTTHDNGDEMMMMLVVMVAVDDGAFCTGKRHTSLYTIATVMLLYSSG